MQGILKSFKPKLINGIHHNYTSKQGSIIFVFIITIKEGDKDLVGEAGSTHNTGSKAWKVGLVHEYTKHEKEQAEGGFNISGLKCVDTQPSEQRSSSHVVPAAHDIQKESYVISRFSHTFALEKWTSLPDEDKKQLKEAYGEQYLSKIALSVAKSVDTIALEIQAMHEERNKKAS